MELGTSLSLCNPRLGAGSGFIPTFASLTGTESLTLSTSQGSDSQQMTLVFYGSLKSTGAQQRLIDIWGRGFIAIQSDNKLKIELDNTGNVLCAEWESDAALTMNQRGLLHVVLDMGASPSVTAQWNGVAIAGTASTLTPSSTLDLTRNGYGFFSNYTGANNFVQGEVHCLQVYGDIEPHSSFWAGFVTGFDDTTNTPVFDFRAPASLLQAGTNQGSGADATANGTFADVDPVSLVPAAARGYGASTTGGEGGHYVEVTNNDDSAATSGSLRWALAQHSGEPIIIVPTVEAQYDPATPVTITRDDVTLCGSLAPGNGFRIGVNRLEIEASNVIVEHMVFSGNDTAANDDSDCIRIGIYSTDSGSTDLVENIIIRDNTFVHGRDEVFAITPRSNGLATGSTVRNVTIENNIIGNPTEASHAYLFMVGDGCESITIANNLIYNGTARFPFIRDYTDEIELINNAMCGFDENCTRILGNAQVKVLSNLYRLTPWWDDVRGPVRNDASSARVYVDGNIFDSKVGEASSHSIMSGDGSSAVSGFSGSGYPVRGATTIAAYMTGIGPKRYGGVTDSLSAAVLSGFDAGTVSTLQSHPGPTLSDTSATYPSVNGNGVPNNYLAVYPADDDPEKVIVGGAYDGLQVARRMADWFASAHYTA